MPSRYALEPMLQTRSGILAIFTFNLLFLWSNLQC